MEKSKLVVCVLLFLTVVMAILLVVTVAEVLLVGDVKVGIVEGKPANIPEPEKPLLVGTGLVFLALVKRS